MVSADAFNIFTISVAWRFFTFRLTEIILKACWTLPWSTASFRRPERWASSAFVRLNLNLLSQWIPIDFSMQISPLFCWVVVFTIKRVLIHKLIWKKECYTRKEGKVGGNTVFANNKKSLSPKQTFFECWTFELTNLSHAGQSNLTNSKMGKNHHGFANQ